MKLLQKKDKFAILLNRRSNKPAGIAQLVEQRTENPRVTSSSLVPGITEFPTFLLIEQGFRRTT